jgi:hypothetical protein
MQNEFFEEAQKILNIYRMHGSDAKLYLSQSDEMIDTLFVEIAIAIDECGILKAKLPYDEFVHPTKAYLDNEKSWRGHFSFKDNKRFFLSDVYDFLKLFYGVKNGNSSVSR